MIPIRLVAIGFAATLASSAQAMPFQVYEQTDDLLIKVSGGCGLGFQRVNGVCVSNIGARHARRYARRWGYASAYPYYSNAGYNSYASSYPYAGAYSYARAYPYYSNAGYYSYARAYPYAGAYSYARSYPYAGTGGYPFSICVRLPWLPAVC